MIVVRRAASQKTNIMRFSSLKAAFKVVGNFHMYVVIQSIVIIKILIVATLNLKAEKVQ